MSRHTWPFSRKDNHNVSVNDGVVTYFAEWDADEDGNIDLQDAAEDYASGARYDFEDDPTPVTLIVTNLITDEWLEYEIEPETDELDEDEDEDADTEEEA